MDDICCLPVYDDGACWSGGLGCVNGDVCAALDVPGDDAVLAGIDICRGSPGALDCPGLAIDGTFCGYPDASSGPAMEVDRTCCTCRKPGVPVATLYGAWTYGVADCCWGMLWAIMGDGYMR